MYNVLKSYKSKVSLKCVLSTDFNLTKLFSLLLDSGKSFQTFADATENALSPSVFFVFIELSYSVRSFYQISRS